MPKENKTTGGILPLVKKIGSLVPFHWKITGVIISNTKASNHSVIRLAT
jgi:hypothetical protein